MSLPKMVNPKIQKKLAFMLVIGALLAIWGIVLPSLINQPAVATRIIELEMKGIDPSAMYYTDLEIAEEISYRVENMVSENPDLLW
jgi:ketopantoate reductase